MRTKQTSQTYDEIHQPYSTMRLRTLSSTRNIPHRSAMIRYCRLLHISLVLALPNLFVPFSPVTVFCDPMSLTSSTSPIASSSAPTSSTSSLFSASSSVNFRCPEQFGYYADEYNCSKYFVCVFGEALHESCTGGLRFSSELQTCDWPRNVVCPSEDLDTTYDDDDDGPDSASTPAHSKSAGSGMVQDVTTSRSILMIDNYAKENSKVPLSKSAHRPPHLYAFTTTPAPATTFSSEHGHSGEQLNEAAVQESFDKLERSSRRKTHLKHQQQQLPHLKSPNPTITYDLVKNNVPDINYIDLNVPHDLSSNKLDANGTQDGDLNTVDDLDENFTLLDLQRSRVSLDGGKSFRDDGSNKNYNDNILGTIGRSVNGANRAQSVSVVASTSSEAIIPELDFVFKKPSRSGPQENKNQGVSERNRISLDDVNLNSEDFAASTSASGRTPKFDEAITAIVDDNGHIHIEGEEGPALLRLLAPFAKKQKPFNGQNSLPGAAASNRNTASQQVVLAKNLHQDLPLEDDKLSYQTSQSANNRPTSDKSTDNQLSMNLENLKNLKSNAGTILVFNRTQLITVTTDAADGTNPANSSSTFILIDHQQPTATVQDGRQSLLSEYESPNDLKLSHRLTDRPRQPIIIRAEKEDTGLPMDKVAGQDVVRGRSFGSVHQNKTIISGQHISTKERLKHNSKITSPSAAAILNEDDDIELLVEIAPSSDDVDDLHRIRGKPRQNNSSSSASKHSSTGNQEYVKAGVNSSQPIQRVSQARHLGTHPRHSVYPHKSNSSSSVRATNTHKHANLTLQLPSRPTSLYQTPEPFSTATKCNNEVCRLPDCFCGGTEIPGSLSVKDVPQLVVISFDDAVNDVNWHIYEELLNSGRSNPNGCPIKATFYVSHEWTDYSQVQTLYSRGHEIASHSITHGFGERFTKQQWHKEIVGQREILHLYGGVNRADIRGMRAPFLQGGGNKQFEMLHEENFTYDSSMPVFENSPPFWPYTLDYGINHECMIAPCPTKSFPGLWEIGLVMWQDLRGGRCSMGDACSNPTDENGVYEMIMKNFKRHYESNKAPFGLYYHSAWFNNEHHRRGFIRVIDDLLTLYKDVYFVTKWELLQWIRNPTSLKELYRVNLFGCARDPHRPPPCLHPNICNLPAHSGARYLKTCQPCPKRYPWLGDSGGHRD